MGYYKEKQIRDWENGYHSDNVENVCADHFDDYAIRDFINESASSSTCSYCGKTGVQPIAAPLDELLSLISSSLNSHYESPDESLPYDTSEGGYQYPEDEIWGTRELLTDVIELEIDNAKLLDDICSGIVNDHWCQRDPFSLSEDKELMFDWEHFSQIVKHKVRYVFFKANLEPIDEYSDDPVEILNEIGKAISKLNLIIEIPPNSPLFIRARQHKADQKIVSHFQIGPPDNLIAGANRFSPAGIPMFYCGEDEITAVSEIVDPTKRDEFVSVGKFQNLAPLRVIDLTKIPYVSIFDLDNSDLYYSNLFLRRFTSAISKKIHKDGANEHIEYVPTQIVTEYFRYMLSSQLKEKIYGIRYNSATNNGGICYVLFFEGEDCSETGKELEGKFILLDLQSLKTSPVLDYLPI